LLTTLEWLELDDNVRNIPSNLENIVAR